jgi:hypothetical protein
MEGTQTGGLHVVVQGEYKFTPVMVRILLSSSGTPELKAFKIHVLVGGVTAASVAFLYWFMYLQAADQEKRAQKAAKAQQQAAQCSAAGGGIEQQTEDGLSSAPPHSHPQMAHRGAPASGVVGGDVESGLTQPLLVDG